MILIGLQVPFLIQKYCNLIGSILNFFKFLKFKIFFKIFKIFKIF